MDERTLKALEYQKIVEKLAERTESKLGRQMAYKIRPSIDMDEIEYLQGETAEALKIIIDNGNPPLFGIHNLSKELKMAEIGGVLSPGSLLKVSDSLRVCRSLKKYLKEIEEDEIGNYPIIQGLINDLRALRHVEDEINNAIIDEDEISDNASNTLKSIRRQIISKNESIRNRLDSIVNSQKYKRHLQDSIITVREGRYVVPIKHENKAYFPGLVHDRSASGATLFVEPMAVVELNNELRDLQIEERDEIDRILKKLSNLVAEEADNIRNNQKILQRLDFIFAKGKLALDMDGTKPILNREGYINLKKARHPLLDVDNVVPIDIYLGDDFNTLVITGPNTGGKTVTLKTVGLLNLLAQSGLHIPADFNSQIPVFDQIFADIGDEQSIEQSLSTFSSHMTNIVDILDSVSDNSLVLFDELGAGTDPTEGAALAMSILDHLLKLNIRTIATTHYSQLKIYALTTDNVRNASVEFDVETLRPTYRLLIGIPGKSNAFEISQRLGLPDYIIDYAREMISKENVEFEDVLRAIDRDRRITEERKHEADKLKYEIEKLKDEVNTEKERIKKSKEKIILRAKEEARSILRRAKEESDNIIKELKQISSAVDRERNRKIQESQQKLKSSLDEVEGSLSKGVLDVRSKEPPKNLNVGDKVKVLSLNQVGSVLEPPDDDGNVFVQVGLMKVNVHISTLKLSKDEDVGLTTTSTKRIIRSKSSHVKSEIDLRGKTLDDALLELDKYIDDVYIAGLKKVDIIHGKGTGVLEKGYENI